MTDQNDGAALLPCQNPLQRAVCTARYDSENQSALGYWHFMMASDPPEPRLQRWACHWQPWQLPMSVETPWPLLHLPDENLPVLLTLPTQTRMIQTLKPNRITHDSTTAVCTSILTLSNKTLIPKLDTWIHTTEGRCCKGDLPVSSWALFWRCDRRHHDLWRRGLPVRRRSGSCWIHPLADAALGKTISVALTACRLRTLRCSAARGNAVLD